MSGERILVIDDDHDLVAAARVVLEGRGYVVMASYDRDEGLATAKAEKPDLIIVDIMMPNATEGFDFVWQLRRSEGEYFQRVPLVVMTAIRERTGLGFYPEGGEKAAKGEPTLPVQGFLHKPVSPEQLLERVRLALVEAWRKG
jgi:CheY-like chemotaxis protein